MNIFNIVQVDALVAVGMLFVREPVRARWSARRRLSAPGGKSGPWRSSPVAS